MLKIIIIVKGNYDIIHRSKERWENLSKKSVVGLPNLHLILMRKTYSSNFDNDASKC